MTRTTLTLVAAAVLLGCLSSLVVATSADDEALLAALHVRFAPEVEVSISEPYIKAKSTLPARTVVATMNLTAENSIMGNDRDQLAVEVLRSLTTQPKDALRRRLLEALPIPHDAALFWSADQAAKVLHTWLHDRLEFEWQHAEELRALVAHSTPQKALEAMALAYRYGVRVLIGSEYKIAILPIVSLTHHQEVTTALSCGIEGKQCRVWVNHEVPEGQEIGFQFGQLSRQERLLYHGGVSSVWSQFSKFERMYLDLYLDAEDPNYAAKEEYLIEHNLFSGVEYPVATNLYADYSGVVSADALAFARVIVSPLEQLPSDPRQPHESLALELKALKELQQLLQDKVTRFGKTAPVERVRAKKRSTSTELDKLAALVRQLESKTCDNALAWLQQREFQLQKKAAPPLHLERKNRQQLETLIEKGNAAGL